MDSIGRMTADDLAEASAEADIRSRKRDSMFMKATLRIAGLDGVHEVRVRNLSAGGMMVEHPAIVAAGTSVRLEMRGLGEMCGQVAWCTRGRIGVALDQPIDPQRVRVPIGTGTTTPSFAKPLIGRVPRPRR